MSFRTAEPALKDVLDSIATGDIQLPDFQRGWVWGKKVAGRDSEETVHAFGGPLA